MSIFTRRIYKKVEVALNKEVIKKPQACEKCSTVRKLCAHHNDYNYPIDVTWLCYSCHKVVHNQYDGKWPNNWKPVVHPITSQ